ncbi:outer membrane protein [uncultured Mediterranean phage]|nr:outer membrane protein [uncultured Mediterranean phage]
MALSRITEAVASFTDLTIGDDLTLTDDFLMASDASIIKFGADADVTLTHVHNTGLLLNSTSVIQFNDASQNIGAPSATVLDINATDEIELNATLVDVNANLDVSGTIVSGGTLTATTSIGIGSAVLTEAELEFLDGITAGTAAASKALILDGSTNISGIGTIGSGAITSSSTIQGTTITATTAFVPDASDGAALGTTSLEFSDLFLADGGQVLFGNDQEITLTHDADVGLKLKHTATADDKPIVLTLQTGETDMAANDVMGAIRFQAPDEGTGTDAILVAAAIQAVSEGDFSSSSNATRLEFHTGASEAASSKMTLSSAGLLTIADDLIIKDGGTIGVTSDADAITIASNGQLTLTQTLIGTALDISGDIDVDGTTNVDALDVDGATNFALDVTFADGSDIITASAGTSNFRAGVNAGNSIASGGNYNVVIGDEAGTAITTGDGNIAVGFEALKTEDAHGKNIAIGYQALKVLDVGSDGFNTVIGYQAGLSMNTGIVNTLIGYQAGDAITTGNNNVAIGHEALGAEIQGDQSVAVGVGALQAQSNSSDVNAVNTAVGYNAGVSVTTGTDNTIVGGLAGDALTDADFNTVVGTAALSADTLGSRSTALGYGTLGSQNFTSATDTYNVAVGHSAGNAVTTGIKNTIIGSLAGDVLTDADYNVALGYASLSEDHKGNKSVAIGALALQHQEFANSTDAHNTAVGYNAGNDITTGVENDLFGALAGDALTDADYNVAVGKSALSADTQGSRSTALGHSALALQNFTSATNSNNTAVGFYAGVSVTTGVNNTLLGALAGDGITTGTRNTALGYRSLSGAVDDGINNTCVGSDAGLVTTGSQNCFVGGYDPSTGGSGAEVTTGSKNTILGSYNGNMSSLDIRTSDNNIVLSDGDGEAQLCINGSGVISVGGIKTPTSTDATLNISQHGSGFPLLCHRTGTGDGVQVSFHNDNNQVGRINTSGSATSYVTSSDYRLKENVVDMTGAIDRVKQLLPKRFNFIIDADKTVDGFLAHEVTAVPEAISGEKDAVDADGNIDAQGIDQSKLVPLLTGALKEAIAKIEALETRVATLEG